MKTERVVYQADGLNMVGHLALPDSATHPRPAVLVFPEAFGLADHAKRKAERIASELGYVALACDLHGDQTVVADLATALPLIEPLRRDAGKVRARTAKALEALTARPEADPARLAAIGFCFGGTMAFELALSGADLKAVVGFHSGLSVTSPGDARQIRGEVLALLGADDPSIGPNAREAFAKMLAEANVRWQMTLYGGVVHGFTNPDVDRVLGRPEFARFDRTADERSWKQMSDLFAEVFR